MNIGILWDLDGTLMDTLGDLTDATNYALSQFGYPPRTEAELRSFIGNGAQRQITLSMGLADGDPNVAPVLALYKEYYRAHCQRKTRPYDGIQNALAALKHYPMAVVSNKPDPAVKALAAQFFPGMYALGETPDCPRKPAPDMLRRAMAALKVEACVYVGDSEVDIVTAKNAGVPCLSVLWGFRDAEQLADGAWFCQAPGQLPEMIENIVRTCYGQ